MVSILRNLATKADPRFFKRKTDVENLKDSTATVNTRGDDIPQVSIEDLEGRPFIITQSDRSAARGELLDINGVPLSEPVNLRGGSDYMFDNNNAVWASAPPVVKGLNQRAQKLKKNTGKDPLLLPQSMAPTGIDFATMPLEAMFKYAAANMGSKDRLKLNRKIRELHPTFKGVEDPDAIKGVSDFGQGDLRKELQQVLDVEFRNSGGLSLPEARLVTSDVSQLSTPDTRIKNVGVIDPSVKPSLSTHPTYIADLAGSGLGSLKENVNAFDLIPQQSLLRYGQTVKNPTAAQKRALSMNHSLQEGVITDDIIKAVLAGSGVAGANASEDSSVVRESELPRSVVRESELPRSVVRESELPRSVVRESELPRSVVNDLQASIDFANYEREQNTLPNKIKNYLSSPSDGNVAIYDDMRRRGEDTIEPNRSPRAINIANFIDQYSPDVPILGQFIGTSISDQLRDIGYNQTKGEVLGQSAMSALDVADILAFHPARTGANIILKNAGKQAVTRGGKTMYHGTDAGKDFDRIDPSKLQGRDAGFLGKGFYSGDPVIASRYAKNMEGGNVQPVETAAGKYKNYTLEDKQKLGMAVKKDPSLSEMLTQQNTSDGYIGARVLDGKGNVVEQVNYFPTRDVDNAITPFSF